MEILVNNGTMRGKERAAKSTFGILEKTDGYRMLKHIHRIWKDGTDETSVEQRWRHSH